MRQELELSQEVIDEHLQSRVPAITKRHLRIRDVEPREPILRIPTIRPIVVRALQSYGVLVPDEAMSDRRKRRPT